MVSIGFFARSKWYYLLGFDRGLLLVGWTQFRPFRSDQLRNHEQTRDHKIFDEFLLVHLSCSPISYHGWWFELVFRLVVHPHTLFNYQHFTAFDVVGSSIIGLDYYLVVNELPESFKIYPFTGAFWSSNFLYAGTGTYVALLANWSQNE